MTTDWISLHETAHAEFGDRLSAVTDWSAPTPDTEWNIHQLVQHVVEEQQWVPLLLEGRTVRQAQALIRPLGDDLIAEWHRYSAAATSAWSKADPESPVHVSYATIPARDYLREQVSDVTIHTWDLARATATSDTLDPALVEAVYTVFEPQKDTLEASGLFASPVPVPADAPLQSRLLALTGRDDRV
ncbi:MULTISPECIES: TIGR03086 family metal-binding protein [Subtercola]|uniref:TIGR03086 family protein n=1 Tax=Subtercola vilae TaxID=2056433 RepID=A0A4T2C3I9_9MICO|nr:MULTISPECIES: TIGR03086 family metal-binding protein [Subtercola]MEA9986534.1 TIGR03086 family metal-binding protein [Subtercola sp. RTI3]TIH38289.1 TIGR03086 family protein [Subtercola vilae]